MMFKRGFGMLALATLASSRAISIIPRQVADIDIDAILNQMEEQYKDPAYAHQFASAALAYASAALPEGVKAPSEEELYAELATMDTKIVPSLLSDAMASIDSAFSQLNLSPAMASQVSEAMSALHNTSVMSRLSGMLSNLLHNLSEDQEEGNIGTPTSIAGDDSSETNSVDSVEGNDNSDVSKKDEDVPAGEDSENEDTSDASVLRTGAYVISVGISLGTMAALF
ncbi:hypothetical protein H4R20_002085 [Coemansia guatemalensis]|uniref:Uncharacterized protein n=1 Tax=Coemansia guatemalensis TaxID=2761395 RepID=A0A9W8LVC6_9FUNG|nr:hypothetical protein H4R20_002085 [Coemansia guatemalensis]